MISQHVRTSCKKIKWGWRGKSCQRDNGLMTSCRSWILKNRLLPSINADSYQLFHQKWMTVNFLLTEWFFFFLLWILMHLIERRKKIRCGKNQMDIPHPWLRVILFFFFFPCRRMHCFDFNVFHRNVRTFSISWYINNGGGSVFAPRSF